MYQYEIDKWTNGQFEGWVGSEELELMQECIPCERMCQSIGHRQEREWKMDL